MKLFTKCKRGLVLAAAGVLTMSGGAAYAFFGQSQTPMGTTQVNAGAFGAKEYPATGMTEFRAVRQSDGSCKIYYSALPEDTKATGRLVANTTAGTNLFSPAPAASGAYLDTGVKTQAKDITYAVGASLGGWYTYDAPGQQQNRTTTCPNSTVSDSFGSLTQGTALNGRTTETGNTTWNTAGTGALTGNNNGGLTGVGDILGWVNTPERTDGMVSANVGNTPNTGGDGVLARVKDANNYVKAWTVHSENTVMVPTTFYTRVTDSPYYTWDRGNYSVTATQYVANYTRVTTYTRSCLTEGSPRVFSSYQGTSLGPIANLSLHNITYRSPACGTNGVGQIWSTGNDGHEAGPNDCGLNGAAPPPGMVCGSWYGEVHNLISTTESYTVTDTVSTCSSSSTVSCSPNYSTSYSTSATTYTYGVTSCSSGSYTSGNVTYYTICANQTLRHSYSTVTGLSSCTPSTYVTCSSYLQDVPHRKDYYSVRWGQVVDGAYTEWGNIDYAQTPLTKLGIRVSGNSYSLFVNGSTTAADTHTSSINNDATGWGLLHSTETSLTDSAIDNWAFTV